MRHSITLKMRSRKGFSLAETFLAVLILTLVTGVIAAGVPVAASVYYKVVDSANAQILLSTTMTVLRDELGTASNIEVSNDEKSITYTTAGGGRVTILAVVPPAEGTTGGSTPEQYGITKQAGDSSVLLVSRAAASKKFYTTFAGVTKSDGVITFRGLEVISEKDGNTRAGIPEFAIRVLTDVTT